MRQSPSIPRSPRAPEATGFENGPIDYLAMPAVTIGIEHLEAIGIDVVHARVHALTCWLLEELAALRHRCGSQRPLPVS